MKKDMIKYSFIVFAIYMACGLFAQNNTGFDLLKNGKPIAARRFFYSEYNKNQQNPKALFDMGTFYLKTDQADSALIFFNKGLAIAPKDVNCQIGVAAVNAIKGNEGEATRIQRSVGIEKTKNIEWVLFMLDAWIKAPNVVDGQIEGLISQAKEINKANPDIYLVKAKQSIKMNRMGDAASDYEMALYFDSTNLEASAKLGDIYASIKNKDQAIKAYSNALKRDSSFLPALKGLGDFYYDYGNYQKSAVLYSKYIQNGEITPKDEIKYGTILYFIKDYSKSYGVLSKVKEDNIVVRRLMAYNQFELKDYANSLKSIQAFFASITDKSKIVSSDYEYFGKILSKNGMDSLAIDKYYEAIKMDSTKKNLYENIGQSYDKQKKFRWAMESYLKLIQSKKSPLASDYLQYGKAGYNTAISINDTIARLQLLKDADSVMTLVVNQSPKLHYGYLWRARINAQIDPETKTGMAKPYYEKVIEICAVDNVKYKKELIESYQYLGVYYLKSSNNELSKTFWQKVLELDPNDVTANDVIKKI